MELHIVLGLLIPVAFIAFTGMVKSLVRANWELENFFLGIDISLAAFANGVVNIVDSVHQAEVSGIPYSSLGSQMIYTAVCIVASFAALLGAMGLHQRFETKSPNGLADQRLKKRILLGVVGNLMGMSVLGMFIYLKLRRLV